MIQFRTVNKCITSFRIPKIIHKTFPNLTFIIPTPTKTSKTTITTQTFKRYLILTILVRFRTTTLIPNKLTVPETLIPTITLPVLLNITRKTIKTSPTHRTITPTKIFTSTSRTIPTPNKLIIPMTIVPTLILPMMNRIRRSVNRTSNTNVKSNTKITTTLLPGSKSKRLILLANTTPRRTTTPRVLKFRVPKITTPITTRRWIIQVRTMRSFLTLTMKSFLRII